MDIPDNLKRLVTIISEELLLIYKESEGYEVQFDKAQTTSLLDGLILSDNEKEVLDRGGRLKVAYWIESSPDES